MDKARAKAMGAEVEAALRAVAEKNGMKFVFKGGSCDAGSFKPRVEFVELDADKKSFEAYASMFGLSAADYGRSFVHAGKTYRLTGISIGRSSKPVIATRKRRQDLRVLRVGSEGGAATDLSVIAAKVEAARSVLLFLGKKES